MAVDRMKAADLLRLLPENALLASAEPADLEELLERIRVEFVPRREVLMRQGDPGESAVILITGTARVDMVASNGREIVLDYLEPGAVIGEIALLDGGERAATVTMIEDGSVLRLSRALCEEFIVRDPGIALRMLQEMAIRLRRMNQMIETDRAFAAAPRLARYLQRLTDEEAANRQLKIDISQSELGRFVGISRENINRQLSSWADAGLIELDHGKIRLIDCEALWDIAAMGE